MKSADLRTLCETRAAATSRAWAVDVVDVDVVAEAGAVDAVNIISSFTEGRTRDMAAEEEREGRADAAVADVVECTFVDATVGSFL